jgi:hypothetical protein
MKFAKAAVLLDGSTELVRTAAMREVDRRRSPVAARHVGATNDGARLTP